MVPSVSHLDHKVVDLASSVTHGMWLLPLTNTLLVADNEGHCIQSFQLNGMFIHKFGSHDEGRGQLNCPSSLTVVDPNGYILVAEQVNCRMSVFDNECNFLHSFGSEGSNDDQFNSPRGVAISPNGSVYITDCDNNRISVY